MKILNNKGFSMVEILAVVVILGVISSIGIVTVSRLVDNSRIHYYQTQEEQLVLAAQSYANDNKNILPKTVGEMKTITLKELRDNNYIKEEIVDQNKNKCYEDKHIEKDSEDNDVELEGSRVEIYKSTKTDYIYTGYLECDACVKLQEKENGNIAPTSCYTSKTKKEPSININIPNLTNDSNMIMDQTKKITITIKGHATENNIRVSSYSYKIYQDNIVKKTSGLKINNKQSKITINEDLYKYVPGRVKVVVTATNSEGISKSVSKALNLQDIKSPKCGRVSYEGYNQMNAYNSSGKTIACGQPGYGWIGISNNPGTRQAWIICNDEFGGGCAQHEYSVNMTTEGENEIVTLSDKSGNKQLDGDKCYVKKCIDKTTPKIVVRIKNGTDIKKTYTIDAQSTSVNNIKNDKYDVWLNKTNYPNGVTVEVEVSDSISKLKSYTWKQNDKNKKENQEGNASNNVDSNTWTYNQEKNNLYKKELVIKDDGVRKEVITATDQAGNSTTYTLILKIDRTPPPPPTSVKMYIENNATATATSPAYTSNTWSNKYVWITTNKSTDNPDISGWKSNAYTSSGKHGNYSDKEANDVHISNEGTTKIKWRSCDYAGNCSASYTTEQIIKLDRTAPKVPTIKGFKKRNNATVSSEAGLSGYNFTWYSGYVLTKAEGSNETGDVSGLEGYYLTTSGQDSDVTNVKQVYRNVNKQGTVTIKYRAKDNAGNYSTYATQHVYLDRGDPSLTFSVTSHGGKSGSNYKNNVHIQIKCTDSVSGVKTFKVGGANKSSPYSTSRTSRGTLSKSASCTDKAGNSKSKSGSYTVVKYTADCTACGGCAAYNYNCSYTSKGVGSGCPGTNGGGWVSYKLCNLSSDNSTNKCCKSCTQGSCKTCKSCWH